MAHDRAQGYVLYDLPEIAERIIEQQVLKCGHAVGLVDLFPGHDEHLRQGKGDPLAKLVRARQSILEELPLDLEGRIIVARTNARGTARVGPTVRRSRVRNIREA